MHQFQNGIPLTIFGITVMEAAALGKIVINRFPMKNSYEKVFGKCAIFNTESSDELKNVIEYLLSLSNEKIIDLQKDSRRWVENCHSYKVIGNHFLKIIKST